MESSMRENIKYKLQEYFQGKYVRKDLTKKIKEGANVPIYVLEYLLGKYCNDDNTDLADGVERVKETIKSNFVRPDESQKILSLLRANGNYTVIDRVTVVLNIKKNCYEAVFSNLGLSNVPISDKYTI